MKILVIRQGGMGDVIMATPIIRELHRRYGGNCEITVATKHHAVLANNPYVAHVISDDRMNVSGYQLIVDLNDTHIAPDSHAIGCFSNIAFGMGAEFDRETELFCTASDTAWAKKFIQTAVPTEKFIVLHLRVLGNDFIGRAKRINGKFWGELSELILNNHDVSIVQIGMEEESLFVPHSRLINCTGKFTIQQSRELIAHACAFVGIDSGPMHIAGCTDTPNFALFTIADSNFLKPLGSSDTFFPIHADVDCMGCHTRNPRNFKCVRKNMDCLDSFDAADAYRQMAPHLPKSKPAKTEAVTVTPNTGGGDFAERIAHQIELKYEPLRKRDNRRQRREILQWVLLLVAAVALAIQAFA